MGVGSRLRGAYVIPADAGIQGKTKHAVGAAGAKSECIVGREKRMFLCSLDSRVRGNDGVRGWPRRSGEGLVSPRESRHSRGRGNLGKTKHAASAAGSKWVCIAVRGNGCFYVPWFPACAGMTGCLRELRCCVHRPHLRVDAPRLSRDPASFPASLRHSRGRGNPVKNKSRRWCRGCEVGVHRWSGETDVFMYPGFPRPRE